MKVWYGLTFVQSLAHCADYSIKTTHQYPEGFYKYLSNLAIVDLTTQKLFVNNYQSKVS